MGLWTSLVGIIFATVIAAVLYVRLVPSNPSDWHLDPEKVPRPKTPNYYFVLPSIAKRPAPIFAATAAQLAAVFDRHAMAQPSVKRLAGSVDALHITYIQRTASVAYPDYLTVKFIPLADNRATVAVFSRSRFGISDKGYNKRRVLSWMAALNEFDQTTDATEQGF